MQYAGSVSQNLNKTDAVFVKLYRIFIVLAISFMWHINNFLNLSSKSSVNRNNEMK